MSQRRDVHRGEHRGEHRALQLRLPGRALRHELRELPDAGPDGLAAVARSDPCAEPGPDDRGAILVAHGERTITPDDPVLDAQRGRGGELHSSAETGSPFWTDITKARAALRRRILEASCESPGYLLFEGTSCAECCHIVRKFRVQAVEAESFVDEQAIRGNGWVLHTETDGDAAAWSGSGYLKWEGVNLFSSRQAGSQGVLTYVVNINRAGTYSVGFPAAAPGSNFFNCYYFEAAHSCQPCEPTL